MILDASRMIPKAFRDVKRCLEDALGDVECLAASYLPGNQVDGLRGIAVVVLGREKGQRTTVEITRSEALCASRRVIPRQ